MQIPKVTGSGPNFNNITDLYCVNMNHIEPYMVISMLGNDHKGVIQLWEEMTKKGMTPAQASARSIISALKVEKLVFGIQARRFNGEFRVQSDVRRHFLSWPRHWR